MSKTVEELEKIIQNVVKNVMAYDGCQQGKIDFLSECGIDMPEVTLVVEVAFTAQAGTDWDTIQEDIQSALDYHCDAVLDRSAYVGSGRVVDAPPGDYAVSISDGTPEGFC